MGDFLTKLLFLLAELERNTIKERVIEGKHAAQRAGAYVGGRAPYGMCVEDGKLIPDKHEQTVIKAIRNWRNQGKSYRRIAQVLNTVGHSGTGAPTPTRLNGKWTHHQIYRILTGKD